MLFQTLAGVSDAPEQKSGISLRCRRTLKKLACSVCGLFLFSISWGWSFFDNSTQWITCGPTNEPRRGNLQTGCLAHVCGCNKLHATINICFHVFNLLKCEEEKVELFRCHCELWEFVCCTKAAAIAIKCFEHWQQFQSTSICESA